MCATDGAEPERDARTSSCLLLRSTSNPTISLVTETPWILPYLKGPTVAKAKSAVDPLLDALKRAIDASPKLLPVIGTKGKALFVRGQESLAESAVSDGYLKKRVVEETTGKKKQTVVRTEYGLITEAGAKRVAEASSDDGVSTILESLRRAVERLPTATAAQTGADPSEIRDAIRDATPPIVAAVDQATQKALGTVAATVEKATNELRRVLDSLPASIEMAVSKVLPGGMSAGVKTALGELQQKVTASLPASAPVPPTTADPGPVLSAIEVALTKLKAEPKVIKIPVADDQASNSTSKPTTSPPPDTTTAVTDDIVEFVTNWARDKTVGPPFDEIMKHLRARHPGLTVGTFQDALRKLANANPPRLKLSGWSKTIHELPEPELALFIKHTVTYYAHPAP